ncbi:MAG: proprotein convertase P-domain-containing protein [Bacteroidetes bacterium]|nr:proprotein convertase P-domain-containing protein [Bacteroidota bacterium]
MKKQLLLWISLIMLPFLGYSQCTTTNATSCACKDGTTNCDLLPDIHVAPPPMSVYGSSGHVEYPQTCSPSCSGNDGRLRVSVSTPNVGFGPLEVRSTSTAICGTDTFYNVASNFTCPNGQPLKTILNQRVYHKNGNTMSSYDRYAGTMTYHPSHGHMHVDDWGIYTLRTATADPNPLNWPVIGTGSKLAFCLMDYGSCSTYNGHCRDSANNTLINGNFPNYGLGGGSYGCSPTIQGISSGYTDIYYQSLDGMWINLPPGLCNGTYWIVVQLDPYNYFLESNENNNVYASQVNLTLQGGSVPTVTASGSTTFCQGGSVSLTATSGGSYLWSNGATTQSITVNQSGSYSVTVSNGGSCSATSAATVVTVSQIPVTASTSSNSICAGDVIQLTSSATAGGTSNQIVSLTNNAVFNIPDNNSTGISSPITFNNINPATINSNTIVSVSLNITHTYDGDLLVQLISPSQNTINLSNRRGGSGNNFNNTVFTANAATLISAGSAPFAGTYRPDGSFSSLTGNVNGTWILKVSDLANTDIGTLNTWTLSLNNVVPTTVSYDWSSNPAGFSSSNQNTSDSPSTTTTYTVVATESGTGCSGSNSVTVNVGNNLNVTTNTPAPICDGQSASLSASGADNYSWSPSTGLSATTGANVIANPSQTITYMVIGTSAGCVDTAYVTLVVNTPPTITHTGDASICAGNTATLQATGAANLVWSPATGLDVTTGNLVNASPSQTTIYTISGSSNGCVGSSQVTVTVNDLPTVTATANADICVGQSANLSANGALTYSWSPSTGLNQSTGVTVVASPVSSTNYTVVGTDINGCTGTALANVNVNDIPAAVSAISGASNLCGSASEIYSVSAANNATSYVWSVPAGVSILTGQGTTQLEVSAGVANGVICVAANNNCGSSAAACMGVVSNVNAPVKPASISGASKACDGSVITYSVAQGSDAVTYNWIGPAGTTILSGNGTNTISLQFDASFTGGNIKLTAINACGTSAARYKALKLNLPATPSSIVGNASGVCNSLESYSVVAVSEMNYAWTVPAGATILSGQGSNAISVQFDPGFAMGTISVIASNACGSSTPRTKTVKSIPGYPKNIIGSTSVCAGETQVLYSTTPLYGASSYTWTSPTNATITSGQGTSSVIVDYDLSSVTSKIKVNAANGCGSTTNRAKLITVNTCAKISNENVGVNVNLLPNPTSSFVEIQYNSFENNKAIITIDNILGQTIYTQQVNTNSGMNTYKLDVREFTKGVYVVSVKQDGKSIAKRLIIE